MALGAEPRWLERRAADTQAALVRGVFGAPGINPAQRAALTTLMTEVNALPAWGELLATRGWDNAFLPGADFDRFLAADIAATETVLKELGLAG